MAVDLSDIPQIDTRQADLEQILGALRKKLSPRGDVISEASRQRTLEVFGEPLTPQQVVERICRDVQSGGVSALLSYSEKLDQAHLSTSTLRVSSDELDAAHAQVDREFLGTIRRIRANISEFQQAILHHDVVVERLGVRLWQRYLPLDRIGICVPGGAAVYPSTLLMTVVPAQAAGVKQLAVMAPPTQFGSYNRHLLATCRELGVSEVYRMGGAHGVAAFAYGVDGIPPVDKIVGPGNLYVALAKQRVFGQVDIDSIAGPSEVVVIGDERTRADFTAADMLAQAEHAPGSSILISWSDRLLTDTLLELQRQVANLDRSSLTIQSLTQYGAFVRVRDQQEAIDVTNLLAPEHLHIATADAASLLPQIRHYGAAFLGNYSPVALGDYVAGPSHVLPTGATARWASGLNANAFLRSSSVIEYTADALSEVADDVARMANVEQLTAHRESVTLRTRP